MPEIEARDVVKYFAHQKHTLCAINGISLSASAGEFVCIVGPSGCGKSTFLRILAGLEKPDSGEIFINGKPVHDTGPGRIMVFQEGALFPWLKVKDNVEFGLKVSGIPSKERSQISSRYLSMMQLDKFAEYYTYQISTGMKQRVAIARALVMDPDVLLMDEPFAALDAQTRDLLLSEMQEIWMRTKKTILFVTHNVSEATVLGTRVVVFGGRPSFVKGEFIIDAQRPRHTDDSSLVNLQKEIRKKLASSSEVEK
ncbi:MAG: nitrate ABC transporter ATP-binding protein [Cenarchaeum symbiont of Oopsacas minuta]|nr:nitrate ABC transporter ATP-binding protein [Cenarchaeum symbiont of Oopsacas minuta]